VDKTDLKIEEIEAMEMRPRARAKRPAFTEERVPYGAVSAPGGNSMQWLCFRGRALTGVRHANSGYLSRRTPCGK